MTKRIILFLLTNLLVMATLSVVWMIVSSFMGVDQNAGYGGRPGSGLAGIQMESLMLFCFVWGMGGAFISLSMSRFMAKMFMGVKVIDPNTHDHRQSDLVQRVYNLSRSAGLSVMPQVGIYESSDINAFATGPTKNRALVAVSTGLLSRMNATELDGVLGHEIAHVANGDMVTMTLLQGIVNAFVMFFARIVAQLVLRRNDDERVSPFAYMMLVWVLEMVFMMLGMIVVSAFSRYREYRADQGGARLAGREKMVQALQAIKREVYGARGGIPALAPSQQQQSFQALMISSKKSSFANLFSTHPDLDDRIARLSAY